MVEAVMARFGRVDVLVNKAGIRLITPAEETALSDWRRMFEVNLTGPFLTSREFGREIIGRGSGSIVNVSSVAGLLGVADRAAYNARASTGSWGSRGLWPPNGAAAACG